MEQRRTDDHHRFWYVEAIRWVLTIVIIVLLIVRARIRRWVRFE